MKKPLLSAAFLLAICASVNAQSQRLALYEEFTGENCGPCASTNPGLWSRVSAAPNQTLLIKYQVPIPSAGSIYLQNPTYADNRASYYAVNSAPSGRVDGSVKFSGIGTTNPGHPFFYQADSITAAAAVASPFTVAVTHSYSPAGDIVNSVITVTCTQAFAPANASMKLRVAYVQTLEYDAAPGTNGEMVFENVVRRMYPDANGTTIANSWTLGQTQTYNISGPIQNYVDKTGETFVVAWLQDDNGKAIAQAGRSAYVPIPLDAKLQSTSASSLSCATLPVAKAHTVVLKNNGTVAMTAATINYRINSAASQSYSWSGNLAVGASTNVVLPSSSLPATYDVITDSVINVNGQADINPVNSVSLTGFTIHNSTANQFPIATSFEGSGFPNGWTAFDENGDGDNWKIIANSGFMSSNAIIHKNYDYPAGEVNYTILPTATIPTGDKVLAFSVAYAQYQTEEDALDVVYSSNCGQTWTSVWTKAGSNLKTAAPITASFRPSSASQWRRERVDITSIPAGAIIAFKGTSAFGNNLYIDSVVMQSGTTAAGVSNVPTFANSVTLAPNPTATQSTLTLSLEKGTKLSVQVVDMMGRVVNAIAEQNLSAGTHTFPIATDNLAAGVYNVRITTAEGVVTQRLSVVK